MIKIKLIDLLKDLELVNSFIGSTKQRPILQQIHVVVENGEVTFTATDSYMMIKKHVQVEDCGEENQDFIVDGTFMLNILKQYKKDYKELTIEFNEEFIKILNMTIPLPQNCKNVEYPKLAFNDDIYKDSTITSVCLDPCALMKATKAISKYGENKIEILNPKTQLGIVKIVADKNIEVYISTLRKI